MAFRVGVHQSEVIYHIWQHRPGLQTHTKKIIQHSCFCDGLQGHPLKPQSNSNAEGDAVSLFPHKTTRDVSKLL